MLGNRTMFGETTVSPFGNTENCCVFPVNLPMKSDHLNRTQERIMYITQRLAHIYTTSVDFSKEISNEKLC